MMHVVPGNPIGKKAALTRIDFQIRDVLEISLPDYDAIFISQMQLVNTLLLLVMKE